MSMYKYLGLHTGEERAFAHSLRLVAVATAAPPASHPTHTSTKEQQATQTVNTTHVPRPIIVPLALPRQPRAPLLVLQERRGRHRGLQAAAPADPAGVQAAGAARRQGFTYGERVITSDKCDQSIEIKEREAAAWLAWLMLTNGCHCDEAAHNAGCGRGCSEEQEEARCTHV